jgi:peptidase inhibitor family I36
MSVRRRLLGATALVLSLVAGPAIEAQAQAGPAEPVPPAPPPPGAPAPEGGVTPSGPDANPEGVEVVGDDIMLQPGVMWSSPDGEVGTQALNDCPPGWLCGWTDANYGGARMAVQQGVWVHFLYWYWDANDPRRVKYCEPLTCDLGPGNWRAMTNSISSVYNRTSIEWAPFYSQRNHRNYYARAGAPAAYVLDEWNDSFTEMCGCP